MRQTGMLWAAKKLLSGNSFRVGVALVLAVMCALPIAAQSKMADEKQPMYGYVAFWVFPRDKWTELEKGNAETEAMLQKAMQSGALVNYGSDDVLVHSTEGPTHDNWWSSMSIAGILNTLEQVRGANLANNTNIRNSANKHWDAFTISRYYNWKPGSYKGAYTRVSYFRFKPDAPDDGLKTLAVNGLVPFYEKLLASGAIIEYEIDEEYIHTENPAGFWAVVVSPNAEGLDKVATGLRDYMKTSPLFGPAAGGMIDWTSHRDYLMRTNATFK
ncbi:MAG TPA: hypothetical protein VMU24_09925 [Candidatus Acidoferrales bacterium]|nr:hypothetical protein [Candidatus Acidoferrales bacterium]